MMRKVLISLLVLLVLVIGAGALWVYLEGEEALRAGIERHAPPILGAPVAVEKISFSPFTGQAEITGVRIGNPDGYPDADAVRLGSFMIKLKPQSVLTDLIDIKTIRIDAPELRIEPGPNSTNLQSIQKNIEDFIGPAPTEEVDVADIRIGDFQLNDAMITIGGGKIGFSDQKLELADIHLQNIGGAEGIAPSQAAQIVFDALMPQVKKALASEMGKQLLSDARGKLDNLEDKAREKLDDVKSDLEDRLKEKTSDLPGGLSEKADEALKSGLGGLLKKKKTDDGNKDKDGNGP
ncbi:DUF748 domain-containing protein [Iodidimonas gelatinilytica]|nr:AsmA family protein [Iodidimonas gelatinilytica]